MWSWLLGILVPLAIKYGVAFVIARFPGIPDWLKAILEKLAQDQAAAQTVEHPVMRAQAMDLAKQKAIDAVKLQCSGVGCPPDVKEN